MGAQLGHNSLGEGDVDSGEVVGKLRARFGVGRRVKVSRVPRRCVTLLEG